ncbi:hypothetical protein L2E82_36149 [Cichorium intybus]|uniref:Uncharacterized protein n=1 Tax=Cichorium intybus TaxID=13427 RepID=A0ACB9BQV6_CICIN|nr:hypothetical protein L2E82_36149 [Cichorium intybus]
MEIKSLPPVPKTVTVRRNPPRRARPTPATVVPLSAPPSSKTSSAIRSFPIEDILSIDIPGKQDVPESSPPKEPSSSEKLKVFLRIKPIVTQPKVGVSVKNAAHKNVWPQNPSKKKDASKTANVAGKKTNEICLKMNDSHSVTLCPPQSLADARRTKSEVYEGFSHVFCAESSQSEVYEKMVNPLVDDFLKGKSGMLAAMGPSGSGKTHTVFGSARDPGMVPLALRQIFSEKETNGSKCSRTFYLSMFEIYSERGKGEKIMDLSEDGGDLFMQQSNIKAMTNSNIQSSRSQCIINIRSEFENIDFHSYFHTGVQSCTALLTIVDLAGAEREKRTGNQGARLLESNFINNTSMVFGLFVIRAPKEPQEAFSQALPKFIEGKKRMALILTAKSGEEDYQDTSYMLRQASPFMNIKFENVEEQPANAFGNKKRTQTLPKIEQSKRMRFNSNEVCMNGELKGDIFPQILKEELTPEKVKEVEQVNGSVKRERENHILLNFSRALWNVLKEYKNKLEASENEVHSLRHNLSIEKERSCSLETELNLIKSCGKEKAANVQVVKENEIIQTSTNCSLEVESCVETVSTSLCVESFQEQSKKKDNLAPCEYVVFDKEDLKELEDKDFSSEIAGCDNLESAINNDSELFIQEDEIPSFVKEDQHQHKEEEKADVSSTNVVFDKQEFKEVEEKDVITELAGCDGLPPAGSESVLFVVHEDEVSSSPLKEDQPKHEEEVIDQKVDESSTNIVSDKLEIKEVEEKEANGELAGDGDLEVSDVHEDEVSSTLEENQQKQEEKEIDQEFDVSSSNIVSDKQEIKEVEEVEVNGELAVDGELKVSDVNEDEVSSTFEENQQKQEEKEDIVNTKSVCTEDVSKLPVVSNIQVSSAMKPKRRLRPASSVMLRNINILDSIDATEMPKHGKRGEKDVGEKRTQGSITLMRLLKQNLHH